MKRAALIASVCVLAGAGLTVAVAWGCFESPYRRGARSSTPWDYTPAGWDDPEGQTLKYKGYRWLGCDGDFRYRTPQTVEYSVRAGLPLRAVRITRLGPAERSRRSLLPLWPGFAINTTLYGTLVFMMWAGAGYVRRRSRRRRGLCTRCGYSRAGLPDGAGCPECGVPGAIVHEPPPSG